MMQSENAGSHLLSYAGTHTAQSMGDLSRHIARLRARLEMNQEDFAEAVGTEQSTVSKWENGKHAPGVEHLAALAQLAKRHSEDPSPFAVDAMHGHNRIGERVVIIGAVQAGHWTETIELPGDEQFEVMLPVDQRYPGVTRTGLLARGSSMNRVFPPGTILVCVSSIEAGRDPIQGEYVIVQRRSADGMIEATVKEYQIDESGQSWLWPRSTDPAHQQPLQVAAYMAEGEDNDSLLISGFVIGSYRIEGPASATPKKNPR